MIENPLNGRQLANFRIERLLGRGGMAQVYFGHDVKLQRPVAIKVIDARYRGNVSFAERFIREARTAATWRHENILQVYYADEEDGLYYFVMEYIDGLDLAQLLSQYLAEGELMPHADVLRIGRAIARALDYAHERGVIHRDVKPSNVMIASDGRVVLADFGLAMDTHQGSLGEIFGTPHYIAPEQARRSADAVPQSDLYALGVVLYEMLTGTVPFDDPSPASLALQHLTLPPPPPREINPDLTAETEKVLLKALSKSPADRYLTGSRLIDALEESFYSQKFSDEVELPPLPAGIRMSQTSVNSRVARHASLSQTPMAYPAPLIASTQMRPENNIPPSEAAYVPAPGVPQIAKQRKSLIIPIFAGFALFALVTSFALFMVLRDDNSRSPSAAAVETEQVAGEVLPTANPILTVAGATAFPTDDLSTPAVQPTIPTTLPTEAMVVAPPATATETIALPPSPMPTESVVVPTQEPPSPAPPLMPTVLYPNGRRFVIYYDENSLYLLNLSSERVPLGSFALERLDTSGTPTNHFDGVRWAQFYAYVHPQGCARVLIGQASSFLNPPECQSYNAEVWVERGMSLDFWTPREGSSQFRVLWNNEEIGRCEIAAGNCEIFIP